ncbi:MAG: hypothetical protein RMJ43_03565 [Chloroherpetonaceae bacterium]|nr:hypothetical protein [Chthonomonadaceae bacterium]MDW8206890.1 hypothetical protein [Chloroherpetonaceae bacterium]
MVGVRAGKSARLTPMIARILLLILLGLTPGAAVLAAPNDPDALTVVAEGMASVQGDLAGAEEEAIWDAKRNAVEKVVGVFLRARAVGRDYEIADSEIRSETRGFVRQWEVVPGSRQIERVGNGRILRIQIRATVALIPVIQHLSEMEDVYNDLERPRIRVEIGGDSTAQRAQAAVQKALREHGFEVTAGASAEIVLSGKIETVPMIRYGDRETPYGVGETVATCRARLVWRVISMASEEALFVSYVEGTGCSFSGDADARNEAVMEAAARFLQSDFREFVHRMLALWARERQDGHAVAVRVSGLDRRGRVLLKEHVRSMRGFVRFIGEQEAPRDYILRFHTRLDTRSVRRRLSTLTLERTTLTVTNDRGPTILCAASARPRVTRR